jgi:hypothetical protein
MAEGRKGKDCQFYQTWINENAESCTTDLNRRFTAGKKAGLKKPQPGIDQLGGNCYRAAAIGSTPKENQTTGLPQGQFVFVQFATVHRSLAGLNIAVLLAEPADHFRAQGQVEAFADFIEIPPYGVGRNFALGWG